MIKRQTRLTPAEGGAFAKPVGTPCLPSSADAGNAFCAGIIKAARKRHPGEDIRDHLDGDDWVVTHPNGELKLFAAAARDASARIHVLDAIALLVRGQNPPLRRDYFSELTKEPVRFHVDVNADGAIRACRKVETDLGRALSIPEQMGKPVNQKARPQVEAESISADVLRVQRDVWVAVLRDALELRGVSIRPRQDDVHGILLRVNHKAPWLSVDLRDLMALGSIDREGLGSILRELRREVDACDDGDIVPSSWWKARFEEAKAKAKERAVATFQVIGRAFSDFLDDTPPHQRRWGLGID